MWVEIGERAADRGWDRDELEMNKERWVGEWNNRNETDIKGVLRAGGSRQGEMRKIRGAQAKWDEQR
jgi:hypothetical protein